MTPHDTAATLVAEPAAQPMDTAVPEEFARAVEGPRGTAGPDAGINETTEQPPAADPAGPAHPDDPAPEAGKADESDAAFILRTFGVAPQRFIKDGVLDRSALAWSVDTYRNLYANRVLSGAAC